METNNLAYFKEKAIEKNLCNDYALLWSRCKNNYNKLFELSMLPQSIPYMATSSYEGWGLSYQYLLKDFAEYINSDIPFFYIEQKDLSGLNYQWKLQENNKYNELNANVVHLCNCEDSNFIVGTDIAELYITNDCDIALNFKEDCRFNIYMLNNSKVTLNNLGNRSKITIYDYNSNNTIVRGNNSNGIITIKQKKYDIVLS